MPSKHNTEGPRPHPGGTPWLDWLAQQATHYRHQGTPQADHLARYIDDLIDLANGFGVTTPAALEDGLVREAEEEAAWQAALETMAWEDDAPWSTTDHEPTGWVGGHQADERDSYLDGSQYDHTSN